ncbi:hypothetical protein EG329_002586 [Mollisiaceae sp. DMI_Dod_QoI]|nr:hypothetical protein EG329_002586 [Helotiales sp. DMI_Dod_QoI]
MLHMAITSKAAVDSLVFIYLYEKIDDMRERHEDNELEPFIHTAVRWRRFSLVDFLLKSDVDIDIPWWSFRVKVTALTLAARSDDVEMASMFLERGANINSIASNDVEFPIESAIRQADLPTKEFKVVKLLLSRGAVVDQPLNIHKDTPLQLAAGYGNLDIIRMLLERKAPVNQYWKCNMTPLMAATNGGHLEAMKLLLDNGAETDPHEHDYGFYSDRGTALQFAARAGSFAIAQLLIERGADINAVGPESTVYGRTPLETATMYGGLDILQLFLNAGAECELPPKKRYASALRIAKTDYFKPNFGIVKLLQEYRQEALDEWNSARILELDS